MIEPKKTWAHQFLMNLYLDWLFPKRFSNVNWYPEGLHDLSDTSILLIGNHVSWWDGFIGWQMNRKFFKKSFFIMMLENQLKSYPFFRGCGAYSIQPGSKSVTQSLKYTLRLLQDSANMVQFYPQGRYQSMFETEQKFNSGIEIILKNTSKTTVVFYVFMTEFGNYAKPYANIFIKPCEGILTDAHELQKAYQAYFNLCLKKHISMCKP